VHGSRPAHLPWQPAALPLRQRCPSDRQSGGTRHCLPLWRRRRHPPRQAFSQWARDLPGERHAEAAVNVRPPAMVHESEEASEPARKRRAPAQAARCMAVRPRESLSLGSGAKPFGIASTASTSCTQQIRRAHKTRSWGQRCTRQLFARRGRTHTARFPPRAAAWRGCAFAMKPRLWDPFVTSETVDAPHKSAWKWLHLLRHCAQPQIMRMLTSADMARLSG
jgi:hypothetical protein